jgi:hypothetical protein
MHYELWELLSRNLLADFDTETEALTCVRDLLAINPPEMAEELILVWRDGADGGTVAEGTALAALARRADQGRATVSL